MPARYLLACVDGDLDEFPYDLWVHHGQSCAQAEFPALRMVDRTVGKGASAVIECASCGLRRPMNEAQGEVGRLNVSAALYRAERCSSDPICAMRTPQDPEDFLHGAACHCCVMASETSCEKANRFLDRRFLIDLPGSDVGFFAPVR